MTAAKAELPPLPPGLAPRLITREQLAAYLNVSPGVIDTWVEGGKLPKPLPFSGRLKRWDFKAVEQRLDELSGLVAQSEAERRQDAISARIKAVVNGRGKNALRH